MVALDEAWNNIETGLVQPMKFPLVVRALGKDVPTMEYDASDCDRGRRTSKEISATSRELVKTMGEVTAVADQSATLANSGQASLSRMEETMRQVMEAAGTPRRSCTRSTPS